MGRTGSLGQSEMLRVRKNCCNLTWLLVLSCKGKPHGTVAGRQAPPGWEQSTPSPQALKLGNLSLPPPSAGMGKTGLSTGTSKKLN